MSPRVVARLHPAFVAAATPERPAVIDGDTGEVMTYDELNRLSNRWAQLLRRHGVHHGGRVAVLLPNIPELFPVMWALQRSGVEYTPINSHLTVAEVAQIANHAGASVLIAADELSAHVAGLTPDVVPGITTRLLARGRADGWIAWSDVASGLPDTPLEDEREGAFLYYSSGTTGQPKGISRRPLELLPIGDAPDQLTLEFLSLVDFRSGDVYLSSAPLYHSAPLGWAMGVHRLAGTVVFTRRFDPEQTLRVLDTYRVTHTQMVPTMFVRWLKLPEDVRRSRGQTSLRAVVHSAAPCPRDVKVAMIEELGEIVYEYYTSTELIGATFITAREWLLHPGSVGRALPGWGVPHVVDHEKRELPRGEDGELWFEGDFPFAYLGDTAATTAQRDRERGWATSGDMGWMDADGYIYLRDRKTYMIISGGVNIYPQDIEAVLVLHPKVADVAVFGIPNPDFGEEVKAVIQPAPGIEGDDALADELDAYCRERLAAFKVPRSYDFMAQLPRVDTGKVYKSALRDPYWVGHR